MSLQEAVASLTPSQKNWIQAFVRQFKMPHTFARNPRSNLVTDTVLENIGDLLRIHHAMSKRSLSKAPFEYAFEKALQLSGKPAKLAESATNPGYDMTIGDVRISLKTEAAKNVKENQLHVSKWMEMGKGVWDPPNVQLPRFLEHMKGYDRILSLRCLVQTGKQYWYELVEIPHALMMEAANGKMEKAANTTQETSPWYCRVPDGKGGYKFSLYFDAGSERKLQVKGLEKAYCVLHATWKFESFQLTPESNNGDDT
jgi:type II restriction enzyme